MLYVCKNSNFKQNFYTLYVYSIVIKTTYISIVICHRGFQNDQSSHGYDVSLSQKITCSRYDTKYIYEYSFSCG
jgi:hypothetical protein